jgi:hypothetical protein
VEVEQCFQVFLQVVFDGLLGRTQAVQGAIQAIFRYLGVGDTQQILQGRRGVPVLRQGELAARAAQAIDD